MTKSTKAMDIQRAITEDIVHGRRLPGTALDEVTLARTFGVSRTPIREAIRQLEMSGLVQARPHRGAVVCEVTPQQLDDMFLVMAELEVLCGRLAARAMTEEERAALGDLHAAMGRLAEAGDRERYVESNDLFHAALYDGSHNGFLAETTRHVRHRLAPFRRLQFEAGGQLEQSFAEHAAILDAIKARDPDAAEAAMRRHMGVVRAAVDAVAEGGAGTG